MALFTNYVDALQTLDAEQVLAWSTLCEHGDSGHNTVVRIDNDGIAAEYADVGSALDDIREQGGMVVFMDNGGNGFYTIEDIA